jgi:hypothetical protein
MKGRWRYDKPTVRPGIKARSELHGIGYLAGGHEENLPATTAGDLFRSFWKAPMDTLEVL